MIAIIDYEIGNLAAIKNMYKRIGINCLITSNPKEIEDAERLILPGNGSFDACMLSLRDTGLIPLITHKVLERKTPMLGICIGAQMLGNNSEEGVEAGLGWIDLSVKRLPSSQEIRIPHMGWSHVKSEVSDDALNEVLNDEARFYFVHSYYLDPISRDNILMTANYGIQFAAAVRRDNIVGVQFHPEKSHRFGKQFLSWFAKASL